MLWLTGSSLVCCVLMILGLLAWIAYAGFSTFWPDPLVLVSTHSGERHLGEVTRTEAYRPDASIIDGLPPEQAAAVRSTLAAGVDVERLLVRTGNYDLNGTHFNWVNDFEIESRDEPKWALTIERLEWGRFYGFPEAYAYVRPVESRDQAEARNRADVLLSRIQPEAPAELAVLVERWVDGEDRQLLVGRDAVTDADTLLGVAEVWHGADRAWERFEAVHGTVRDLWHRRRALEEDEMGVVHERLEDARLRLRQAELDLAPPAPWVAKYRALAEVRSEGDAELTARYERQLEIIESEFGRPSAEFLEVVAEVQQVEIEARAEFEEIMVEIHELDREMERHVLHMSTADASKDKLLPIFEIVRAYPANQIGSFEALGIYISRWVEFIFDDPRESNFEGGVWPAIFGTVLMTLIMCIVVVPFGVLAALYLREYAKAGPIISTVRIAVNNLAGVPSIVFGVFGVGFFCYIVGASIDELFFEARLPQPTFGTGGLLWASMTLALLTLPVVIVATEEALAAVPNSMREGSYACGASKWQTIRRIVLPRAMPGIMTGAILAMARGAGEVAPLMLVGAVKLAPKLPLDLTDFPSFGVNGSFMHLGFHVYDLGFQSQNSEAAKPMVFTTTLLLIGIIATLNLTAVWLRTRLHRKFVSSHF